jgi:O-antigen ligase
MKFFKEDLLKYGTLLLFFLTPIVFFGQKVYPHITSKTFFFYGFAGILFFYWLYIIIIDKSYRLSKKQWIFFIPLFLYIIWMTLAGILATNSHLSFWSSLGRGTGLLTLYYSTAVSIVVASLVKRNGMTYVYSLLKWFMVSALIVAISVWLGDEGLHIQSKLFLNSGGGGLMGNSSLAAAYLIFAFFLGFYLLFAKSISVKWKWFVSIIMSVIIFSPLFINIYGLIARDNILGSARGAILGIMAGLGAIALIYFALSKNKIIKIFGLIGIFASLITFSIGWMQFMKPDTIIHNKFTEVASGTRFLFWDVAQKSIDKHPWFGYGPENFMIAFQENFDPKILDIGINHESWNDRAHNMYFETGVNGGYPAIAFYFIFILSIFYAFYRIFKKEKISRLQASILCGLVVAYIFQNLFVFDSVLSIMIFFTLAGLVYGLDSYNKEEKNKKDKKNERLEGVITDPSVKIFIGGTLVVLCVTSLIFFAISPARKATVIGVVLNIPIEMRYLRYNELLRGSSVGNDWDVSGFADDSYKDYARNPQKVKSDKNMLAIYKKDLTSFLEYLETIAKENPTDYRLYIKIFHLYSTYIYLNDQPSDPILMKHLFEVLNQAKELSPTNPEVYWGMAQLYAWQGDFKAIEQVYKEAIAIDPKVSASHKLLIQFAGAIKDQKLYNEAIIQAEKDIPGFVEANKKELNITVAN